MKRQYTYDFVLSFAGEDREIVEEVKGVLIRNHFRVFYDFDEQEILLGKDLAEYFSKLYQDNSEYCVMFISNYYIRKPWAKWERRAALARAFKSRREYILPYFLDSSKLPSIPQTIGRAKFPDVSPKDFAALLTKKYHQEHNAMEIMDGVFIKNVELPGRALAVCSEGYIAQQAMRFRDEEPRYGFERGVRFNFSIVNTNDSKLWLSHSWLQDENHFPCNWARIPSLIHLNLLSEPLQGFYGLIEVEPHEVRNFGFIICSFCWEQSWDFDEDLRLPIFKKLGPLKVVSNFAEKIVGTKDAIEEVVKSFSDNNFAMFNNVSFDICMTLGIETESHSVCVETTIYENQARFIKVREVKR